ncbi:cobalt-precorrin-5B (C(1))-methyltransferase CbiD [Guggenheimella bovis]
MPFEAYKEIGKEKLRLGFTTGTAATLAVKAALLTLLTGEEQSTVSIVTPSGMEVETEVERTEKKEHSVRTCVKKDGGDDIDQTHELEICAEVEWNDHYELTGGEGIGIVTKRGLSIPVGDYAINPVPRQMIKKIVHELLDDGKVKVSLDVPQGREAAKKTFNERMGIEGGISIIGTSGIVEPMSNKALIETIRMELNILKEAGEKEVLLTPGNIGTDRLQSLGLKGRNVQYSNFLGEALDFAAQYDFSKVTVLSHIGKLVKVSLGAMDTHSRTVDGRKEAIIAEASLLGVEREILEKIDSEVTTEGMFSHLKDDPRYEALKERLYLKAKANIERRLGHSARVITFLGEEIWGDGF